jgi:hypothetical protein
VSAGRRLLAVADALPVTVLAVIAGAGSFTRIRDTAAERGQSGPMSWAVAVCVPARVVAARERQRDRQLPSRGTAGGEVRRPGSPGGFVAASAVGRLAWAARACTVSR